MALDPRTPVIVGAGQYLHRADGIDDALQPVDLMVEAVRAAADDAGTTTVISGAQSWRTVMLLSWRYRDPSALVAERLGVEPKETVYTTAGGNTPQSLVNGTAAEIQAGDLDSAVLIGGEAWRTRMRARRADATLEWDKQADEVAPTRVFGSEMSMNHPYELARGVVMPVQVYPMFETALRAAAGAIGRRPPRAASASCGPGSARWRRTTRTPGSATQKTAEEIRTPSPSNRMIGLPYPKLMNSNNDVDMAAALIMCSVEKARALGVAEDRWVFLHSGTDCHDTEFVSNRGRPPLDPGDPHRRDGRRSSSPASASTTSRTSTCTRASRRRCSSAPRSSGSASTGDLTRDRRSVLRRWPVEQLRDALDRDDGRASCATSPGSFGFVGANGGYVTKHAFGVYSTTPPADGLPPRAPAGRDRRAALAASSPRTGKAAATRSRRYTVMHDRDGNPETAVRRVPARRRPAHVGRRPRPGVAQAMPTASGSARRCASAPKPSSSPSPRLVFVAVDPLCGGEPPRTGDQTPVPAMTAFIVDWNTVGNSWSEPGHAPSTEASTAACRASTPPTLMMATLSVGSANVPTCR